MPSIGTSTQPSDLEPWAVTSRTELDNPETDVDVVATAEVGVGEEVASEEGVGEDVVGVTMTDGGDAVSVVEGRMADDGVGRVKRPASSAHDRQVGTLGSPAISLR